MFLWRHAADDRREERLGASNYRLGEDILAAMEACSVCHPFAVSRQGVDIRVLAVHPHSTYP